MVGFERTVGIAFVIFGDGEVAEIPLDRSISVEVFLDGLDVEEGIDADVIDAAIISRLMQTFHVEISQVSSCHPEI